MTLFVKTESTNKFIYNHCLIVYNTWAGKGRAQKECKLVVDFFNKYGIRHTVQTTSTLNALEQFDCLVLIGGDGTLNYILNQYFPIPCPILFIKGGTGNDFYTHLYGKYKTIELLETLLHKQHIQAIDLGKCNQHYFINGFGFGFDAAVVQTNTAKKRMTGKLGYLFDVLLNLFTYNEQLVTLKINNEQPFQCPLFMLTIANGRTYGGGFKVAPKAKPNDGLLEYIAIHPIPKWKRLLLLPIMDRGWHLILKKVNYQQINSCEISSQFPISVHLDGELKQDSNFSINLLPQQVQFLVP